MRRDDNEQTRELDRAWKREKGEHVSESERTSIRGYSRDRKRGSEIKTERLKQTEGMRESVKERRRERERERESKLCT